jgi:hypothetical protein
MKVALVLSGGLSALLGCSGGMASTDKAPIPHASQPSAPATEPVVAGFRLTCDARTWRAAFALGARTRVSGRVQRRSGSRWTVTRTILPRTLSAGRQVVELGRLAPLRSYHLRFLFWRSPERQLTLNRKFRATCDGRFATPLPLPEHPEPSLPVGSGGPAGDGSGESSTGSKGSGTTGAGP